MSTHLHDIANAGLVKQAVQLTAGTTGNTAGTSCDMLTGEGRLCIIQSIGAWTGTSPTIQTKVQESADGSNWYDITGASFSSTATSNTIQSLCFSRNYRYVRSYDTIAGTGSLAVPVTNIIIQQKKQF